MTEDLVPERSDGDPALKEPLEVDPRLDVATSWPGAVLLNDEIEYYSTQIQPPLLYPFDPKQLKPARYQLRLGGEARINGILRKVNEQTPLVIEPHQVAIVRTYERLNIPRFLIGRWNLRVDMVYRGLLWVGALQVDPGWRGYLPCPLYNMSNQPVELQYKDSVFTIDFVRTTPFRKGRSKPYKMQFAPNPVVSFFDRQRLHSGPYDQLERLSGLVQDIDNLRAYMNRFIMFVVAALGIVVAAIGVIAATPNQISAAMESKGLVVGLAILSLVVSLAAFNLAATRLRSTDAATTDD